MNIILILFFLGIRILITVYCIKRAGLLNRDKTIWGVFGFLSPLIAIIILSFLKPKNMGYINVKKDFKDSPIDQL
ncbi:MAG: hypothetical protein IPH42_03730 [Bacteroidetes bacterium]|jgi:hypothetical protein|nr:hypothetical protein [Bacteroidota bacterium]MBP9796640.1 hypothetical protein [Chitinophagales bacterium]